MQQGNIGFMQGRMSPLVDGKIQSFPWDDWKTEFKKAQAAKFSLMEWTIDQDRFSENPLVTEKGQRDIQGLCRRHGVRVSSVTADCFMHAPFFKVFGIEQEARIGQIKNLIRSSSAMCIDRIVFPLVDQGSIENERQQRDVVQVLLGLDDLLREMKVRIIFESDFDPQTLKAFISCFPNDTFGINLDIGNSAALGFPSDEEIGAYGDRIYGVHVKDREYQGSTVPLGEGSADIPKTLGELVRAGYQGDYVLQPARAVDDHHVGLLIAYKELVHEILRREVNGS